MNEQGTKSSRTGWQTLAVHLNRDWLNLSCAILALALATYQAFAYAPDHDYQVVRTSRVSYSAESTPETQADGSQGLRDFGGTLIPLKRYQRIASASTIADEILSRLCEPERIIAFTERSGASGSDAHRYRDKALITSSEGVEAIVALKPDLLLLNPLGNEARKQRLVDAGLTVFDLGAMRGMRTLIPNILSLGWLIGEPERARAFAHKISRRMASISADVPKSQRLRGMYIGIHGSKMYGGTRGTSYEDILHYAGLNDIAAEHYEGWPAYTPEQVLELDPELVITQDHMSVTLCNHTELSRLRVCSGKGTIIEVDRVVLGGPGLSMIEAAERIHDAVYGAPKNSVQGLPPEQEHP